MIYGKNGSISPTGQNRYVNIDIKFPDSSQPAPTHLLKAIRKLAIAQMAVVSWWMAA
jgi:hypothetical protein